MSAISESAGRMVTFLTNIGNAIDGIALDVAFLKQKIQELQDSAGKISPEDQAILKELEQRAQALSERVAALDAETTSPQPPV